MANNYIMALAEGAMYSSYKEFQTALATFCRQTNSRFTVHDCKKIELFNSRRLHSDPFPLHLKYKYAKVACERYGQPRHEGKGLRKKGSKKSGCGAHVTVAARKTERETFLTVVRLVTTHSNQCEIRRKQKRNRRRRRGRPEDPVPDETPVVNQNAAPNTSFLVKQELIDNDEDSMQEYNYDVKPVVVYSDEESEFEEKPIPIFHLKENHKPAESTEGSKAESTAKKDESPSNPSAFDESASNQSASNGSTTNDSVSKESTTEDVTPLPLADKPSLRALLLPAMALNFSQPIINAEELSIQTDYPFSQSGLSAGITPETLAAPSV